MEVFIRITAAGVNSGPLFNLFQDSDGFVAPFATDVPLATLLIGSTYTVDGATTQIKITDIGGVCDTELTLNIIACTTTTTTTVEPTTTTTSTTIETGSIIASLQWTETNDECGLVGEGCGLANIYLGGVLRILDSSDNTVANHLLPEGIGLTQPYTFEFPSLPASDTYKVKFDMVTMHCDITSLTATICDREWSDTGHGSVLQSGGVTTSHVIGTTLYCNIKGWFPII